MSSQNERNEGSIVLSSQGQGEAPKKSLNYIPGDKSGKWSDQEHMKYIIFIDYNKEKMRSKQTRRSNKFYEEMAQYISTRNSLQCRSHHQKIEEKYTHVNKIIAHYKGQFNKILYKKHLEQLDTITHEKQIESLTRYTLNTKIMVDAEIQTDIKDIRCDLVVVNPNLIVVMNKRDRTVNPPMSYRHSPIYYPPPIYSSIEASRHTFPSMSPYGQMGLWNGYYPSRF